MIEKYNLEQAQNEAYDIKGKALELKDKKNESGEPSSEDYKKSEQLLETDRQNQKIVDDEKLEKVRQKLNGDSINEIKAEEKSEKYTLKVKGDSKKIEDKKAEDNRVLEGERKETPLNSEKGKELTDALHGVAALFNKLGAKWKLDGAINISLKEIGKGNDAFFRNHRDVDVHVFGNIDGNELSKILAETKFEKAPYGYGAFFKSDNEKDQLEFYKFEKGEPPKFGISFFKLDENGEPYFEIGDVPIDVHFDENTERSEVTGKDLPRDWQRGGGSVNLKGEAIQLDHPGSMLYFKLSQGRKHDLLDIDFMLKNEQFGLEDIGQVRRVLEEDQQFAEHSDQKTKLAKALEKITAIEKELNNK